MILLPKHTTYFVLLLVPRSRPHRSTMAAIGKLSKMTWAELLVIVEDTPGALEQVLVHLERTGKIPKQLTKDGVAEEETMIC